jgi:hypothetical protein
MGVLNFSHSGKIGDVIFSIPTILELCKTTKQESALYLIPNILTGDPYDPYRLTDKSIESITPLLELVIDKVAVWKDEVINVPLDLFRKTGFNPAAGHLPRHYNYCWDVAPDLTKPWLDVDGVYGTGLEDYIIVSRSLRYRNQSINYKFLNEYKIVFLGLPDEWKVFQFDCPDAKYVETSNLLEVAQIIKTGKAFVGNQSACFAIAEAMKVPRLLEVSIASPNVVVQGGIALDAINQIGFEANFGRLNN